MCPTKPGRRRIDPTKPALAGRCAQPNRGADAKTQPNLCRHAEIIDDACARYRILFDAHSRTFTTRSRGAAS
eukprot:690907-Prymnesium_polylepis.1